MSKRLEVKDTQAQSRPLTEKRDSDAHETTRKGTGVPGKALRGARMDDLDHEAEFAKFKLEEVRSTPHFITELSCLQEEKCI